MSSKTEKLLLEALKTSDNNFEIKMKRLFVHIKRDEIFSNRNGLHCENMISENEKSIKFLCDKLREYGWVDTWDNENIVYLKNSEDYYDKEEYDNDVDDNKDRLAKIKRIMNVIIILPEIYKGPMSGVYVLHLLHGEKIHYYGDDIDKIIRDNYADLKKKLYQKYNKNAGAAYIERMERKYGFDLSLLNKLSFEKDAKNGESSEHELFTIIELRDYLMKYNIMPDFDTRLFKVKGWMDRMVYNRWYGLDVEGHYEQKEREWILLRTLLLQCIKVEDLKFIGELQRFIYDIEANIFYFMTETYMLFLCIDLLRFKYSDNNFIDTVNTEAIKMISDIESGLDEAQRKKASADIIQVKQHTLIKQIVWRMIREDCLQCFRNHKALITMVGEQGRIDEKVLLKTIAKDEQVDIEAGIGVKKWEDFYNKYEFIVKTFYWYSDSDKKIKTLWLDAIKNIVPINWGEIPYEDKMRTPNEDWYDKHGIDISVLKITDVFKLMNLFAVANNVAVKMGGDNTKRFEYITNEKILSNKRIKYNTLKNSINTIVDYNEPHLVETIRYASSTNIYKMGMSFENEKCLVEKFGNIYDKLINSLLCVDDITNSEKVKNMIEYILAVADVIIMGCCNIKNIKSLTNLREAKNPQRKIES